MPSTGCPHPVGNTDTGPTLAVVRGSHDPRPQSVAVVPVCYPNTRRTTRADEELRMPSSTDRRGPRPEQGPEHRPATPDRPPLEIHRSARRRRSASAAFRDDRIVVRLPAGLPAAEEQRLLDGVVRKVTDRHRPQATGGDAALAARAALLADRYLDGVRPTRVTWSNRMGARYGSCTPTEGTIRISAEMAGHPEFVRDYVLVHELAHLQVSGHGPAFHALVARFPEAERARGYLDGYRAGRYGAAQRPNAVDVVDGPPAAEDTGSTGGADAGTAPAPASAS
jgi:hypothetical protein